MSDRTPIRVLLADDQTLVRAGFKMVLEKDGDIDVVAEAADGRAAVDLARQHRPDVALLDVRMPEVDGIEAACRIIGDEVLADTRVVMLTTFEVDDYVTDALEAGAAGFLLKDIEPDELRRAVRVVAAGQAMLSPSVTSRLLARLRTRPTSRRDRTRVAALTEREREVVMLVARGLSNDEIATALVISPATAKTHVSRAMTKLHARDRAQLVVIARDGGLAE